MARRRLRLTTKFYTFLAIFVIVIVGAALLLNKLSHRNDITFGSLGTELEVSAAIVRDETVITTERFEKVTYDVVEGATITPDTLVCEVFKRGYQDETMVTLLNLQKQIYAYQMQLTGGFAPAEAQDVYERIATVEAQMRSAARGQSELDMLSLEATLKGLLEERATVLKASVPADDTLNSLYNQETQQKDAISNWKHNVVNTAGTGVISFYFDGYESALSATKLSTVNAALVTSVVSGNNTTVATSSGNETPLYRLINPAHWYVVFVTKADDPMRLTNGEEYYVTFTDYSDTVYQAVARESVVSASQVVNILEFTTDIGKLVGIRTVAATITKSAQGLIVPSNMIQVINGIPGVNLVSGDSVTRVEVDVLAEENGKVIVKTRDGSETLQVGQKLAKPVEIEP